MFIDIAISIACANYCSLPNYLRDAREMGKQGGGGDVSMNSYLLYGKNPKYL